MRKQFRKITYEIILSLILVFMTSLVLIGFSSGGIYDNNGNYLGNSLAVVNCTIQNVWHNHVQMDYNGYIDILDQYGNKVTISQSNPLKLNTTYKVVVDTSRISSDQLYGLSTGIYKRLQGSGSMTNTWGEAIRNDGAITLDDGTVYNTYSTGSSLSNSYIEMSNFGAESYDDLSVSFNIKFKQPGRYYAGGFLIVKPSEYSDLMLSNYGTLFIVDKDDDFSSSGSGDSTETNTMTLKITDANNNAVDINSLKTNTKYKIIGTATNKNNNAYGSQFKILNTANEAYYRQTVSLSTSSDGYYSNYDSGKISVTKRSHTLTSFEYDIIFQDAGAYKISPEILYGYISGTSFKEIVRQPSLTLNVSKSKGVTISITDTSGNMVSASDLQAGVKYIIKSTYNNAVGNLNVSTLKIESGSSLMYQDRFSNKSSVSSIAPQCDGKYIISAKALTNTLKSRSIEVVFGKAGSYNVISKALYNVNDVQISSSVISYGTDDGAQLVLTVGGNAHSGAINYSITDVNGNPVSESNLTTGTDYLFNININNVENKLAATTVEMLNESKILVLQDVNSTSEASSAVSGFEKYTNEGRANITRNTSTLTKYTYKIRFKVPGTYSTTIQAGYGYVPSNGGGFLTLLPETATFKVSGSVITDISYKIYNNKTGNLVSASALKTGIEYRLEVDMGPSNNIDTATVSLSTGNNTLVLENVLTTNNSNITPLRAYRTGPQYINISKHPATSTTNFRNLSYTFTFLEPGNYSFDAEALIGYTTGYGASAKYQTKDSTADTFKVSGLAQSGIIYTFYDQGGNEVSPDNLQTGSSYRMDIDIINSDSNTRIDFTSFYMSLDPIPAYTNNSQNQVVDNCILVTEQGTKSNGTSASANRINSSYLSANIAKSGISKYTINNIIFRTAGTYYGLIQGGFNRSGSTFARVARETPTIRVADGGYKGISYLITDSHGNTVSNTNLQTGVEYTITVDAVNNDGKLFYTSINMKTGLTEVMEGAVTNVSALNAFAELNYSGAHIIASSVPSSTVNKAVFKVIFVQPGTYTTEFNGCHNFKNVSGTVFNYEYKDSLETNLNVYGNEYSGISYSVTDVNGNAAQLDHLATGVNYQIHVHINNQSNDLDMEQLRIDDSKSNTLFLQGWGKRAEIENMMAAYKGCNQSYMHLEDISRNASGYDVVYTVSFLEPGEYTANASGTYGISNISGSKYSYIRQPKESFKMTVSGDAYTGISYKIKNASGTTVSPQALKVGEKYTLEVTIDTSKYGTLDLSSIGLLQHGTNMAIFRSGWISNRARVEQELANSVTKVLSNDVVYANEVTSTSTTYKYGIRFYQSGTYDGIFEACYDYSGSSTFKKVDAVKPTFIVSGANYNGLSYTIKDSKNTIVSPTSLRTGETYTLEVKIEDPDNMLDASEANITNTSGNVLMHSGYGNRLISQLQSWTNTNYNREYFVVYNIGQSNNGKLHTMQFKFNKPGTYKGSFSGMYGYQSGSGNSAYFTRTPKLEPTFVVTGSATENITYSIRDMSGNTVDPSKLRTNVDYILTVDVIGESTTDYPLDLSEVVLQLNNEAVFLQQIGSSRFPKDENSLRHNLFIKNDITRNITQHQYQLRFLQPNRYNMTATAYYGYAGSGNSFYYKDYTNATLVVSGEKSTGIDIVVKDQSGKIVTDLNNLSTGVTYSVSVTILDSNNLDVSQFILKNHDNNAFVKRVNHNSNFINNLGDNFTQGNPAVTLSNIKDTIGGYSFNIYFNNTTDITVMAQGGYSAVGSSADWIERSLMLNAVGKSYDKESFNLTLTLDGEKVDLNSLKTGVWYDLNVKFTNNCGKMSLSKLNFLSEDEDEYREDYKWKASLRLSRQSNTIQAGLLQDDYLFENGMLVDLLDDGAIDSYHCKVLFKKPETYHVVPSALYALKNVTAGAGGGISWSTDDPDYFVLNMKTSDSTTGEQQTDEKYTEMKVTGPNYDQSIGYELYDINGDLVVSGSSGLEVEGDRVHYSAEIAADLPYTLKVHVRDSAFESCRLTSSQLTAMSPVIIIGPDGKPQNPGTLGIYNTRPGYTIPSETNSKGEHSQSYIVNQQELNGITNTISQGRTNIEVVSENLYEYELKVTFAPGTYRFIANSFYAEMLSERQNASGALEKSWGYSNNEHQWLDLVAVEGNEPFTTQPSTMKLGTGNEMSVHYNQLKNTQINVKIEYQDTSIYRHFGTLKSHEVNLSTLGEYRTGYSDVPNTTIKLSVDNKLITDELLKEYMSFESAKRRYRYEINSESVLKIKGRKGNEEVETFGDGPTKSYGYINLINNPVEITNINFKSDNYNGANIDHRYYLGVPLTIEIDLKDYENDIWKYNFSLGDEVVSASGYYSLISNWNADGSGNDYTDGNFEVLSVEQKDNNKLVLRVMPKTSGNMLYSVTADDAYTMQIMSNKTSVTGKVYVNKEPTPPVAIIAGPDRIVIDAETYVTQKSTDINDDIIDYEWELIGEQEDPNLTPLDSTELTKIKAVPHGEDGFALTFPESALKHKFIVQLTVKDATNYSDSTTHVVEVIPPIVIPDLEPDIPPIVDGYTVIWEDGFGNKIAEKNIGKNEAIPDNPEPPKINMYIFDGWSTPVENGKIITITALWKSASSDNKQYTVMWMNGYNDTPIKTEVINANDPIPTYPTGPVRSGFVFWGWSSPIYDTDTIIITARWRDVELGENQHRVTWYDGFGGILLRVIVDNGDAIPAYPTNPTHNSCEFKGWSAPQRDTLTDNLHDIAITALWNYLEPEDGYYLVEWKDGHGGYVDRQIVANGHPVPNYPYTPVWNGHKFTGWSTPVNSTGTNSKTGYEYRIITITAQWIVFNEETESDFKFTMIWMNGYNDIPIRKITVNNLDPVPRYPSSPTRPGYVFVGWTSPEPPLDTVTEGDTVIIEALWEEIKAIPGYHLVSWYDSENSNELIDRQLVKNGDPVPKYPDTPEHEKKAFLCWTAPITRNNGDIDIYALYRNTDPMDEPFDHFDTYKVRWMSGYSPEYEIASTIISKYEGVPQYPNPPVRQFYTFAGWSNPIEACSICGTEQDITVEDGELVITIHALWDEQVAPDGYYAVTWYDDDKFDNEIIDKQIVKLGDPVPSYPKAPTHALYKFTGWTTPDETDIKNIKIYAQYIEYRNVKDPDGFYDVYWVMSRDDPTIITQALNISNLEDIPRYPASPTRPGYTFIGWESPEVTDNGKKVTIYAMWREASDLEDFYKITWIDGYTNKVIDKKYAKLGDPIPTYPNAPSHIDKGYRFSGWARPVKVNSKDYEIIASYTTDKLDTSVKYIVRWFEDETFESLITYQEIKDITNELGDVGRYPASPERSGYVFMGWADPIVRDAEDGIIYIDIGGIWEKANIVIDYYYVTWEDGFGNIIKRVTIKDSLALPPYPINPTKEGYLFNGWTGPDDHIEYIELDNGGRVKNIRILAMWINQSVPEGYHTVTWYDGWHSGEAGVILTQIVKDGDPIPDYPVNNPARPDYVFDGWGRPVIDASNNVSITAMWVSDTEQPDGTHYVIWIFDTDDYEVIKKVEIKNGDPIPGYPSSPVKPGFIFAGWDDPFIGEDGTTVYIPALWADPVPGIGQHLVIWEDGFGHIVDRKIVNDTDPIPPYPENPTHVTCTFDGWHEPLTLSNGNILIVAKWILEDPDEGYHVVTWYAGYTKLPKAPTAYGDMVDRRFVKDGDPIPAYPNNPKRDSYTFDGWGTPIVSENKNVDIVAKWIPYNAGDHDGGNHDVVWISYNNIEVKRVTVDNGEPIPRYPSSPIRPGYVFAGWLDPELGEDGTTIYIRAIWDDIVPVDGYYIVTWFTGYGNNEIVDRRLVKIGEPIPAYPKTPVRAGYFSYGWDTPVEDADGNVAITALWTRDNPNPDPSSDVYIVRWVRGPGNIGLLHEVTVKNGDGIPSYPGIEPTRTGFIFFGWKAPYVLDEHTIIIEANWKEMIAPDGYHLVKWIDGFDKTIIKAEIVKDGDAIPEYPSVPNHEGQQFIGWQQPAEVDGNIEIVANYTDKGNVWPDNPNDYTEYDVVWYRYKGGDELRRVENVPIDKNIPAYPNNPTRDFYVFAGWSTPEYHEVDGKLIVVIYGLWNDPAVPEGHYMVTWWDGYENIVDRQFIKNGDPIPSYPENPEPLETKKTFNGWGDPVKNSVGNIDITANWRSTDPSDPDYDEDFDNYDYYQIIWDDGFETVLHKVGPKQMSEFFFPRYPVSPEKNNLIFAGWSAYEKEIRIEHISSINEDKEVLTLIIHALWDKKEISDEDADKLYGVTWVDGFNHIIKREIVAIGDPIPSYPNSPVRKDLIFKGWAKPRTEQERPLEIVIEATWRSSKHDDTGYDPDIDKHDTYSVVWVVDKDMYLYSTGSYQNSLVYKRVDGISKDSGIPQYLASPTRDNLVFMGWDDPAKLWENKGTEDENLVIVIGAIWKGTELPEGKVAVTWYLYENGPIVARKIIDKGGEIPTYPNNPMYEPKLFIGWGAPQYLEDGSVDIIAKWRDYDPDYGGEDGKYTVTWLQYEGGPVLKIEELENTAGIGEYPDHGKRLGLQFNGWSDPHVDDEGNIVIWGLWGPVNIPDGYYSVSWWDGISTPENNRGTLIGFAVISELDRIPDYPEIGSRDGYTFAGWQQPVRDENRNIHIVAQWRVESTDTTEYTVRWYRYRGGDIVKEAVIPFNEDIPSYPVYAEIHRPGYIFDGWTTPEINTTAKTITIIALWRDIVDIDGYYVVTWLDGFGSIIDRQLVKDGDPIPNYPASPTHETYLFNGWSGVDYDEDGNATITALWKNKDPYATGEYTVRWLKGYDDPNPVIKSEVVRKGVEDTGIPDYPSSPKREGYIFIGWSNPQVLNDNGDIDIIALWKIDQENYHTVTWFDGYTDIPLQVIVVRNGMPIPKYPNNPTRKFYIFNGWGTPVYDKYGNITITALWRLTQPGRGQHSVTWWDGYGEIIDRKIINNGDPIPKYPSSPTHLGKIFAGWGVPSTDSSGNIDIFALWRDPGDYGGEDGQYRVTWMDGYTPNPYKQVILNSDQGIPDYPDAPTRLGYTFIGWSSPERDPDGEEGDLIITARWSNSGIDTSDLANRIKVNRSMTVSGTKSFQPADDPIIWGADCWSIVNLATQDQTGVYYRQNGSGSDHEWSSIIAQFDQVGQYEITLTLKNKYTQNNPNSEYADLTKSSFIVNVIEDMEPVGMVYPIDKKPSYDSINTEDDIRTATHIVTFNVTGFSDDGDKVLEPSGYKWVFEEYQNGKMNTAHVVDASRVKYSSNGKTAYVSVPYKFSGSTTIHAKVTITETFGEKYVEEWLSSDGTWMRSTIVESSTTIKWKPVVKIGAPTDGPTPFEDTDIDGDGKVDGKYIRTYPDDIINGINVIVLSDKTEEKVNYNVTWELSKLNKLGQFIVRDESGVRWIDSSKVSTALTAEGGSINITEPGIYKLKAYIKDPLGDSGEAEILIRVYSFPIAVLKSNTAKVPNTDAPWTTKENILFQINTYDSIVDDEWGKAWHQMDFSKDTWSISGIYDSGNRKNKAIKAEEIFIMNIANTALDTSSKSDTYVFYGDNSALAKANNPNFYRSTTFTEPGIFTLTYQGTNFGSKKTEVIKQDITVTPDSAPEIKAFIADKFYREAMEKWGTENKATATLRIIGHGTYGNVKNLIEVVSPDGDNINRVDFNVTYDANNNKLYTDSEDKTWEMPGGKSDISNTFKEVNAKGTISGWLRYYKISKIN